MAPKKFTYTPGTGGGKRTKAFAKKGAASKAASAKDKAALDAWAKSQQARGAFGPVTGTSAPGSKPAQFNMNAAGMGSRSPLNKQVKRTTNTINEITGVAPAQRIARGKGSKADVAFTAMSVLPVGKVVGAAVKGGKAAMSGIRGAEAVASTTKAGTKAFGKTEGVTAIKKASATGRKSVIAKRTESDAATIKRGEQKSKTQEMAQKLEQQAAKENSSKSVFQSPESTVRVLPPASSTLPRGFATKAEVKAFGEARNTALNAAKKQGRTPTQIAQAEKDRAETINALLAGRGKGARAGGDIPGEYGASRVGGPAADAATAAPAKAKPAPKPGPKQTLRENARLTPEPTGRPKKPSARSSQAVRDKYAKDIAAYEKQQAKFDKQQAAIKQKTTDIEMGKAKGPSAAETGKPMVKTGPAKEVKKPRVTKPKAAKPETPTAAKPKPEVIKGEVVPSTKGPQTPSTAGKDLVRVPRKARVTGSTRFPAEGSGPIPIRTASVGKEVVRVPRSTELATSRLQRLPKKGNGSMFNKKQKAALALTTAGGLGIAVSNKNEQRKQDAANAATAATSATPPTTSTQAKTDARHPSPDVWLDKYGRRISEAEFNRRKAWWAKAKTMDEAEFKKAYLAEGARRKKYISGAGKKKFGAAATAKTMNQEVPRGVPVSTWNKLSESEKTRFKFKYGNKPLKAAVDWLNNKQNPNR